MIASLILLLSAAALQPGAVDRRPPVDQCASEAGFAAFRASLHEAIARRDGAFILSIVPDDILVNFGGEHGREAFARQWRLDQGDSPFWAELEATLSLGCMRSEDGELVAPSLVVQLDDQDDPFSALIAVRSGAVLRARPDDGADTVATLDWDVLTWRSGEAPEGWVPATLSDGRNGWVRRADVRSAVDYRAYFAREDGRWRMTIFIAGD